VLKRIVPLASTFNTRTSSKSGGNDDEETRQGSRGCSLKSQPRQKEAKQEALSKEQFSHMKGSKVADSLEHQKQKEQAKR
jgi:hypothetical protein